MMENLEENWSSKKKEPQKKQRKKENRKENQLKDLYRKGKTRKKRGIIKGEGRSVW